MAIRDALQERPRACQAQQRLVSWRCADAPSILRGEVRRSGELFGIILGKRHAQHMGKCEGEREATLEQEDEGRQSIVQDIVRGNTTKWEGWGAPCRMCVLVVTASRMRTTFGRPLFGNETGSEGGGVRLAAASTSGKPRATCWSHCEGCGFGLKTNTHMSWICDGFNLAGKEFGGS